MTTTHDSWFLLTVKSDFKNILNAWDHFRRNLITKKTATKWHKYLRGDHAKLLEFTTRARQYNENDILVKAWTNQKDDLTADYVKEAHLQLLWNAFMETWKGWTPEQKINDRSFHFIRQDLDHAVHCRALSLEDQECLE